MTKCTSVIFDMDGLVLDTEPTYVTAWLQAANAMGICFDEDFCWSLSGQSSEAVQSALSLQTGHEFDQQEFYRLSGLFWRQNVAESGLAVKKGFYAVLDKIKAMGLPYALATNSQATNAQECLSLSGLNDVFDIIVTRDDVSKGKPEPDLFFYAAERLKQPLSHCLIIEDSLVGLKAGQRANGITALIPSRPINHQAATQADYVFADLDELAMAMDISDGELRLIRTHLI